MRQVSTFRAAVPQVKCLCTRSSRAPWARCSLSEQLCLKYHACAQNRAACPAPGVHFPSSCASSIMPVHKMEPRAMRQVSSFPAGVPQVLCLCTKSSRALWARCSLSEQMFLKYHACAQNRAARRAPGVYFPSRCPSSTMPVHKVEPRAMRQLFSFLVDVPPSLISVLKNTAYFLRLAIAKSLTE